MNRSNLYRVFLLRLWREEDSASNEVAPLRIVLEEPRSGKRQSFPTLGALLVHLQGQVTEEGNRESSESQEESK